MSLGLSGSKAVATYLVSDPGQELLATQTNGYQQSYALRRSHSTMATVAREQLAARAVEWAAVAVGEQRAFRVLSVGCGDGDLDLALLEQLTQLAAVDYLGLEVNPLSVGIFHEAVRNRRDGFPNRLDFEIRIASAACLPEIGSGFDLVVMSHVLYYFSDPVTLVRDYLYGACRLDGRLVVVHSGREGIPRLMADIPGIRPFLCAEDIRDGLVEAGTRVACEMLDSELDASEILAQTPVGDQILGFCVERDTTQLSKETKQRLLKAFWSQCEIRSAGVWIHESLGFLTLRNDLGVAPRRHHGPSTSNCDPVEDYHRLAKAFDWPARFALGLAARGGTFLRVLDIGCGRGRWLTALRHHWPELAQWRRQIQYSAIDPSSQAVALASERAQEWMTWGQGWTQKVETISDLPVSQYDIAWSMHALYCVGRPDLEVVLGKIIRSLRPDGLAVIALPDLSSFYISAAMRLASQPRFTCAEDVCDALTSLGLEFDVRQVKYEECISAHDELALRKYVWEESIGNSCALSNSFPATELPGLPVNSWFESHRQAAVYSFPQNIWVVTVRGGQALRPARDRLLPDTRQMKAWADVATQTGLAEHAALSHAAVIDDLPGALPPRWVHEAHDPGTDERLAMSLLEGVMAEPVPEWGDSDLNALLQQELLPLARYGTRDNAPGYMAYVPSGGLYLGAVSEWLAALLNRYSAMFMASPGLAAIEASSIRWLNEISGMQASAQRRGTSAGGLLVSGASMATVTAVHAARHKAARQGRDPASLVAYLGGSAHCCIDQALSVCAIPHRRVIAVRDDHRVDMGQLERAIADDRTRGLDPFFIALSAGEVETGAIDDLELGRALADGANAWLHVDGAYGGFFVLARSAPAALSHAGSADSLCLDPHKGMGLPYGTGSLLVQDVEDLRHAFSNTGNYLPPAQGHVRPPNAMDLGIEMTRPFRGLRLWLPIKLLGIAPFRDHLEHMLRLARWLSDDLRTVPGLELIGTPALSICTFQLKAPATEEANRRLLDEINADGRFFLSGCKLSAKGGGFALRVALLSFRTNEETVRALAIRIRECVHRLEANGIDA